MMPNEKLLETLAEVRRFVKFTRDLDHGSQMVFKQAIDEAINHIAKQKELFDKFRTTIQIIQQYLPPDVDNGIAGGG